MRIATNTVSEAILRQIQQLGGQQAKLQTQVATGQRITNPEDDPTAVGRVLTLESQQRQVAQFKRNSDLALERSQSSYAGLQSIKKLSDRAGEIAVLGTGAMSADSGPAYGTELDQLIEQALQQANSRSRNDYIFGGTAVDAPPYQATRDADGRITAVSYVGNTDRAAIPLSETTSVTPGTSGATNEGIRDFINELVSLRDALLSGDATAVAATRSGLHDSEDLLVSALAEHGGVQTRIEANQAQLIDRTMNLESLVSAEADLDLPTTIVRLNQAQVAYQAALQSSANIMRLSLLDYIQ